MTRIVEDAKRIIEENYGDPDLNVSGIARQLYVSPQYLSRLFRAVSGDTCTVSYTHLDVYKRQALNLINIFIENLKRYKAE